MNTQLKKIASKPIVLVILGVAIGMLGGYFLFPSSGTNQGGTAQGEAIQGDTAESASKKAKKPLYWVAPMDANYRRDQPGKSPMGMDLVPVYEDETSSHGRGKDYGEGAVSIAPHVINNLGVRTAIAKKAPLVHQINTLGVVQYDQDSIVHIHPRVAGWVEQLFVKAAGDQVKAEQPLYALYSPELVNAQEEFLIALNRANAQASKNYPNNSLVKAAKARLSALHLSEAFIERLAKSRQVQQNVTFYAPKSGVINNLKIREGFYVEPGNTLMSIGDLSSVWVEAQVLESDASFITIGNNVSMSLDFLPGQVWQGEVDYLYPTLRADNRTLRARLKFTNPNEQLKPNMFAQITIDATPSEPTVNVPLSAVIRTGLQDRVVLALGDGQFKSVAVRLGQVSGEQVAILDGLMAGDEVVISAQFLIDSESSVSSDLMRMSPLAEGAGMNAKGLTMMAEGSSPMHMADDKVLTITVPTATVNGIVNAIVYAEKSIAENAQTIINISRDAIEKWQRPATTMDFTVSDNLDLSAVNIGDKVRFTFEIRAGDFVVTEINAIGASEASQ
ncbi:efflux RND transporter periplasmic adaptor subunit [Thalassotalea euphylliae]|uniref:Efflux RND transporter periplasmic adaptor subunit n=1 Tax=Thalassotalea euphylliae TaxID=1655234 RepID=A0A3E0TTL7_9GAMM|nr:efflux RND transporter periplasmic adaptor subunit [Thalassotalea euphylliae]REL27265.1 efflux RND transporter periplasmic adaptor subunit [Thalassotalea euphylliae]